MSSLTMVLAGAGPTGGTPRGPTIDLFPNNGARRCGTRWQHPLGGPPSTSSSTMVVDTA
jgi:hypothetical protein